jgi:hypothetical protein
MRDVSKQKVVLGQIDSQQVSHEKSGLETDWITVTSKQSTAMNPEMQAFAK